MEDGPQDSEWIEAVVAPLHVNPELGMAARAELRALEPEADPEQCRAIARRLERQDRAPARGKRWRRLLFWFPLLLALAMLGFGITQFQRLRSLQHFVTTMEVAPEQPGLKDRLAAKMGRDNHLLVFGDTSQPTEALARKALWDHEPANPAFFAEYVAASDPPPDDFLETARRLDPGNGWFLLIAAGVMAEDAVEKQRGSKLTREERDDPRRRRISSYEILDRPQLANAIALLHEAAAMERLEFYQSELLKRRLEVLPPETDFQSRVFRLIVAASSDSTNVFRVMRSIDLIGAEAQRLAASGELEELRRLVHSFDILCHRFAEREGTMIHGLIAQAMAIAGYEHLLDACEKAKLTDVAERLRPVVSALQDVRTLRKSSPDDADNLLRKHGEMLTILASPRILSGYGVESPAIEEMRAGRLMDYALFERLALLVLAIILILVLVPLAPLPRLRGQLARQLGRRFSELIGPRDWVWIVGLGTVTPLLWYYGITYLTPLGCRDWSVAYMMFQPAQIQAALVPYLIVASNLQVIRWRLGQHAGSLRFGLRRPVVSLIPTLLIALAIPVAGLVRVDESEFPLWVAGSMGGIATIWFLFLAVRFLLGSRTLAPSRVAETRLMRPALAWAAVLALALIPFTLAAEWHFLARDALLETSPANLGMGRIEAENTAAIYRVLQEALESP